MNFDKIIDQIKNISSPNKYFKPHKYLALLVIIEIIADGVVPENQFKFDERFRSKFTKYFTMYHRPGDRDRPLAPFFHLKNSVTFWHLRAFSGKEAELARLSTIGTPKQLYSCIDYAYIDQEVFNYLRDPVKRHTALETILECLQRGLKEAQKLERISSTDEVISQDTSGSLFEHEAVAIELINAAMKAFNLGETVSNLLIYDNQTNDYYECDLIVIAPQGIYVVELKHWSGKIRIAPYNWIIDGVKYRRDPHAANRLKVHILKGIYQHQFRTFPDIWVESVVVLTNPDSEVEGVSPSKTDKHCPSFGSIDDFIDFLRYQRKTKEEKLDITKIERIRNYLDSLQHTQKQKGFSFPGFEIVERLTERPDLIEYVVRPADGRIRKLQRFRVFLLPQGKDSTEKDRFMARARNTLDAIARTGEDPNILRVWPVPDETGLIIEGSDWSDQGTLRDFIDELENPLQIDNALNILKGLLNALIVVHRADIIHRAIKPENILMVNDKPKLMNFDLSYQLDIGEHVTVMPDSTALKRDPYTAPELYHGNDIDERTDLFSIGVIFYELLTGSLPFKISKELEVTNGRMTEEALQKLSAQGVPQEIREVIDKLIRLDRKQRIRDAISVQKSLGLEIRKDIEPEKGDLNRRLEPGEEYDVFTIDRLLSEGPISQVYLARTVGNDPVVIKIFNYGTPLQRIQSEEKTSSSIVSPYLVQAKRIGHWKNERFFLELNYIAGRIMREDIKDSRKPDLDGFKRVTLSLLEGVYALHNHKIDSEKNPLLHCDIKPDNIILTDDGSAVLIDFGISGSPRIDQYQGTARYIAPDLVRGGDIKFSENGDLFALGTTLFEWFYAVHPYEVAAEDSYPINTSNIRSDEPDTLTRWLLKAVSTKTEERFQNIEEMQTEFQEAIREAEKKEKLQEQIPITALDSKPELEEPPIAEPVVSLFFQPDEIGNPFVAYLNSLHNATGANENALAESQARNSNFCHIHVPLQITDHIFEHLVKPNGSHIILTGNAGDGKSTICLELYKRFKGMAVDKPLASDLQVKEVIKDRDHIITLIKDMSELTENDRLKLLQQACQNQGRYFIISNTGTLLNAFQRLTENRAEWLSLQDDLLAALDSPAPTEITVHRGRFKIINVARTDSIDTALKIFDKVLAKERWEKCDTLNCCDRCPIYANVKMLRANKETALMRIDLFYRRLFEYGFRLTIRQMTEHLAYAITAGLDYYSIQKMSLLAIKPPLRHYLFFNRFFGDCGDKTDIASEQINAIRYARTLESGLKPNPRLDRMLWVEGSSQPVYMADEKLNDIYSYLRMIGRGIKDEEDVHASSARLQVRRLLYLYGIFKDNTLGEQFVSTFIDSPMIKMYMEWKKTGKIASQLELKQLKRGVIHILQEHFTSLRLPETAGDQETVFITLNRRNYDIRQTAQIVLAKIPADDFELSLKPVDSKIGVVQYQLNLKWKGTNSSIDLDLPFLDYVYSRHQGEIAQQLRAFYVDRLEKFKVTILENLKEKEKESMMLVRLQLNHQFKSQKFSIHNGILEVTN